MSISVLRIKSKSQQRAPRFREERQHLATSEKGFSTYQDRWESPPRLSQVSQGLRPLPRSPRSPADASGRVVAYGRRSQNPPRDLGRFDPSEQRWRPKGLSKVDEREKERDGDLPQRELQDEKQGECCSQFGRRYLPSPD